ncbi:Fic family protein [Mitsuaria sp. GD03876]|uniref:Fic family protein n=1 Tax=Mitsuaria sp. GD03876 TaxID=2975399 RepID=UPI002449FD93|nr:Fic family protein [Mitsuaria sp. GD03876]MDH0865225.1 Fic family protein [Mitsuaria sp. GD03876]
MNRISSSPTWIWQRPDWPDFHYDAQDVAPYLTEAYLMHGGIEGKAVAIGLGETSPVVLDLFSEEVVATAAIEGERLSLDAVRSSVKRRLGLDEDGPVDRSVDGLVAVIADATTRVDRPLDEERLCLWQGALFPNGVSGMQRIAVGRYRDHDDPMQIVSGRPGREVVHYVAPPSRDVPAQMARFLDWFAATTPRKGVAPSLEGPRLDGLARAAIAHFWFESIHPFEDGNGRVGRAIVDLAIAQHLRPPMRLISLSRQLLTSRRAYYDALNEAQLGTLDVTPLVRWFARQYTGACDATVRIIDSAIEKRRFWDTHAATALAERQRKVLQRLLDDGDGGFLGGLNAEKYIKMTGVSKATATRDLTEMTAAGQLRVQGVGKAARYYIDVPGWTHGVA